MTKAAFKATANVRKDVRIGNKTTTVRMHPAVWDRFVEIAREGGDSISVLAQRVRDSSKEKDLSRAIIDYVQLRSGNQPLTRHKTREAWLAAVTDLMRPVFEKRGYRLPEKIVCTMGFPSTGWRGKRRGECWGSGMSAAGNVEIFIHPCETSVERIANILTHELCHAADEQHYIDTPSRNVTKKGEPKPFKGGHGKVWTEIAHALDITEGKGTHALGGAEWKAWAMPLVDQAGPIPFDALSEFVKKPAKQTTRMLKFEHEGCEGVDGESYVWRASAKGVSDKEYVHCPCCGTPTLNPHCGEGDSEEPDEVPEEKQEARPAKRRKAASGTACAAADDIGGCVYNDSAEKIHPK